MAKSYFEEFEKKYNRPRMNDITVGFSGIDPAPKSEIDSDDVSTIANTVTENYLNSHAAKAEEVNAMLNEVWGTV